MQYKKIIVYFLIISSSLYKFGCDYSFGMESSAAQTAVGTSIVELQRAELKELEESFNNCSQEFKKMESLVFNYMDERLVARLGFVPICMKTQHIVSALHKRTGISLLFVSVSNDIYQKLMELSRNLVISQYEYIQSILSPKAQILKEQNEKMEIFFLEQKNITFDLNQRITTVCNDFITIFPKDEISRAGKYPTQKEALQLNQEEINSILIYLEKAIDFVKNASFDQSGNLLYKDGIAVVYEQTTKNKAMEEFRDFTQNNGKEIRQQYTGKQSQKTAIKKRKKYRNIAIGIGITLGIVVAIILSIYLFRNSAAKQEDDDYNDRDYI